MKNLLLLCAMLVIVFSCNKDDEPSQTSGANQISKSDSDFSASSDLLQLDDVAQIYRVDEDDFIIKTECGVLITAEPGSFVFSDNKEPVTGEVDFKVIELFTKSDIMRFGIQTSTYRDGILVSEGELYLEARKDGRAIELAPSKKIRVRVPDDEPIDETELFFAGDGFWTQVDTSSTININEWPDNEDIWAVGYDAFLDRLGWVNYDYFLGAEDLRKIDISLPEGYTANDTHVWVFFDDLTVALNMAWDSSSGFFAYIPSGTSVTFVAIHTKNGIDFEFDELSATVLIDESLTMAPSPMERDKIIDRLREIEN